VKMRRVAAAFCGLVAAVVGTALPAAADVPVVITFSGDAGVGGQSGWNVADWPFPDCDPTQKVWTWYATSYSNLELDSTSAYVGEAAVNATMTSVTPCAPWDSGTMTLSVVKPLCYTTCYGTSGTFSCSFSGTFLRLSSEITMLQSGSCSVNGRPSVAVPLLQGHFSLYFGPPQPIPYCGCAFYVPPTGANAFEFSNTAPTG
jgi:hypothetical protein